MIGSYRDFLRQQNKDVSTTFLVAATDTGTKTLIASVGAKYSIFVQAIIIHVLTTSTPTQTYQDNATTPVVVDFIPASPTAGSEIKLDYGDDGFQLTQGKELDLVLSAAGLKLNIRVEAYARIPVGVACVPADL